MNLKFWHASGDPAMIEGGTITIARGVLRFIENEVRKVPDELETGGLLLGRLGPGRSRVVLAASPPGPSAVHHAVMFERDLAFCQYILDEGYRLHQLQYVGEWHKHPRDCTEPSWGDQTGCRTILQDPAYKIDGLMLFPIFTLALDGTVKPHYYCMDRSLNFRTFDPGIEDLEDFTDSIKILEKQYGGRSRRGVIDSSQPNHTTVQPDVTKPTTHWYETSTGKQALAEAVEALKSKGLTFEPRVLGDGRLAFAIRGPMGQEMTVICAETHPIGPPVIQISNPGNWSQTQMVSDYISQVYDFFANDRHERLNVLI